MCAATIERVALVAAALFFTGCAASAAPPLDLRISEVSAPAAFPAPTWIEIENPTSAAIDLSGYELRARALDRTTGAFRDAIGAASTFALPSHAIPASGFVVVFAKTTDDQYDGATSVDVVADDLVPSWEARGSVEIVSASSTTDFVAWGDGGAEPLATDAWDGPNLPAFDAKSASLARAMGADDEGDASAFHLAAWATPGGPNDVTDDADDDGDGIPDSAERPGGTFAGLPLYDWGAREGVKDVFVEIDWMDPKGYDGSRDAALEPTDAAMTLLERAFAKHEIALHVDRGELGGGEEIPFACRATLDPTAKTSKDVERFAKIKAEHFDLRRAPVFHYAVFANSQDDVACGEAGASGAALAPGRDLLVTLGRWGFNTTSDNDANYLANAQAATTMHELGHGFGLLHGGDEATNFKPNYLSTMNYLYDLAGLPKIGASEGDRYYYEYAIACGSHGVDTIGDLEDGPTTTRFVIDYSDGSSAPIDEANIDETRGLGRAGSAPVDFDWSFAFSTKTSADADAANMGTSECVKNGAKDGVLRDHDDWSSLVFDARVVGAAGAGRAPTSVVAHEAIRARRR